MHCTHSQSTVELESHSTAFPRKNTIHPEENRTQRQKQDECRQILVVDTEKQKYEASVTDYLA